ncbi:hypothetical protein MTR67_048328 [Solanum verrucosum]|uniref:SWIM-type domain-containing protein n=1 Tax=Solanum verrucosum TaxID=315347 RepID=A0AAF0V193_SOLVR|nr:hypothetical protein MTR67_048328 [Solanum verrucosum]
MDIIIVTRFHHGGKFVEDTSGGGLTYIGESEVEYVGIDKDHFSLMELLFYTRDLGYVTVGGFYFKDPTTNNFVLVDNDFSLLNLIKDLGDGDFLDLYVQYVIDEVEIIKDGVPTDYLCGPTVGEIINEDGVENSHNINVDEGLQQGAAQSENISIEVGVDEGLQQGATQSENINVEVGVDDASDLEEEIILGVAGVDRGFEDIGRNKVARYVGRLGGDEQYIDSSELDSDDSRDELDPEVVEGVDLPARRKSKRVRFDPDCVVAIFELGMVFENAIKFRKAVAEYAVEYKVRLKLRPNEKHRVRVKCQHKKCKWLLYASLDKDSGDFIVKNYYHVHQCPTTTKNKFCTSNFITNKFRDRIVSQPYIKLWKIQELVRKTTGLYIERTLCYRAKLMILKEFMGDWKMEFARLCDYADMIKQTNPGSSCWVRTDMESTPGKNMFVYFYVCFDALKRVVDQETKHSWRFFINFLIQDLNLGTGHGLTVISDMQKGLVAAIMELLPDCEQRMCARHIWSNWQKNWRGEERRKQFWRCAKSSFEVKFQDEMDKLDKLDISPMASLVLEENKDYAGDCQVRFNGQFGYEILDGHYRHIIDIRKKTCTCRTWQLRGIPCQHVVLAYQHAGQDPEDHVVHWYRKDTFMKAYNYFIQPIHNMKMWPHTSDIVIEPPEPKQMPGRPPKCRRKSKDEPRNNSSQPQSSRQPTGYSQPPSSSVGSSQPPSSRKPRSCSQPPSSGQPLGSSQPPTWRTSQHGKRQGGGGDDTSTVTRGQQAGRGKGRERASTSTSTSTRGNKRPKTVGFGIYTDDLSGRQTLNPGTTGERVVTPAIFKCATPTNIDIGYKPRGLKWKGKDAVTTPQLQRMSEESKEEA